MPKNLKFIIYFVATALSNCIMAQDVHIHNESLPCLEKHFNVAVHVVLDSDGNGNITRTRIEELFDEVQPFFEPICLSFSFCHIDTIHNNSFDTLNSSRAEKLAEHFNRDYMLNLFLTSQYFALDDCHIGSFEGIKEPNTAYMYQTKYCNGASLAHVIGHVLGLLDTNEDTGTELVDGSNCATAGDRICDTPADPYYYADDVQWTIDCKFIEESHFDPNGDYYNPQVSNIMSPYYLCRKGFTVEQFKYMAEVCESVNFDLW